MLRKKAIRAALSRVYTRRPPPQTHAAERKPNQRLMHYTYWGNLRQVSALRPAPPPPPPRFLPAFSLSLSLFHKQHALRSIKKAFLLRMSSKIKGREIKEGKDLLQSFCFGFLFFTSRKIRFVFLARLEMNDNRFILVHS